MRILFENGADPGAVDGEGKSAKDWAAEKGNMSQENPWLVAELISRNSLEISSNFPRFRAFSD